MNISVGMDTTQVDQAINKITTEFNNMANKAKEAFASMGNELGNINNKLKDVENQFGALGVAIIGVGLGSFITNAITAANDTTRLAEAVGVTTQSFMEMQLALVNSGKDADALGRTMLRMEATAQQAADGNQRLRNAYHELGISMEYLQTHSPEETFKKVVDSLGSMENAGLRAELTMMTLGRDAKTIDFSELSKQLSDTAGSQSENAKATEDAARAYREFNAGLSLLKNNVLQLIDGFLNLIGDNAKGLLGSKVAAEALVTVFGLLTAGAIVRGVYALVTATAALAVAMGPITIAVTALATALGAAAYYFKGDEIKQYIQDMLGVKKATDDVANSTDKLKKPDMAKNPVVGPNLAESPEKQHYLALQQQIGAYNATIEAANKRLQLEISLVGASDEVRKSKMAQFDQDTKNQMEISKIDAQIAEKRSKMGNLNSDNVYLQKEIDALQQEKTLLTQQQNIREQLTQQLVKAQNANAMNLFYADEVLKVQKNVANIQTSMDELTMTNDEKKIANIQKQINAEVELAMKKRQAQMGPGQTMGAEEEASIKSRIESIYQAQKDATEKEIALSREWNTGWTAAYKKYVDEGTNAAKMAGDAFNSITNNMNSAIDNFVTTGKFSFSDFARSVVQDLIKIELKAEAMQLFKAVSGGTGSILGSIFSGLGFAEGGDPPVGKASIVGENGPELFVPKTPGTIVPNGAMGGGASGASTPNVTHNYNYNINAIDQRSVAQFFAENRKTMLGTVQMAQKELPYYNQ